MRILVAAVAVSLVAGLALGAWLVSGDEADGVTPQAAVRPGAQPLEERILSIEQLMAEERQARIALEEQLFDLAEATERLAQAAPPGARTDATTRERVRVGTVPIRQRDFAGMVQQFEERRLRGLVGAGFSEDEARRILRQESAAEFGAMQAAWEAQRRGESPDPMNAIGNMQGQLRAELGDTDYERYLAASGQPTSIQVTRVLDGSPGSGIGIEPGDRVVAYDGKRIYSVAELRELTLSGTPGEDVIIEVERNGVRMQLSIPRGPVGISGTGVSVPRMSWFGGG